LAKVSQAVGSCTQQPLGAPLCRLLTGVAVPQFTPDALSDRDYAPALRTLDNCRMDDKVNLSAALDTFDDAYSPRIVGYLNDYKLAVVKARKEFVWHKHDETDDFFLVLHGRLTIQLRDRDVELSPGEVFVVPRGVEHCPRADEEAHVLLIEPRGTANTGDAGGRRPAPEREL
jgi:mannose-6-phosphate isomerase-like protein (cupin superfamily)